MLSKDEILKKKCKAPEQLDLVTNLDDDKSKIKSRLLLILFLFIFVGSSSGLWIYREYQLGKISLTFSLPVLPNFSNTITLDKNIWQICFFDKKTNQILYEQNCRLMSPPSEKIKNNIDLIKSSLPNGLDVSESISTSSSEISYLSDISSPKFNYYILVKVYGSYPLDISQNLIPKIANDLYWKFSK